MGSWRRLQKNNGQLTDSFARSHLTCDCRTLLLTSCDVLFLQPAVQDRSLQRAARDPGGRHQEGLCQLLSNALSRPAGRRMGGVRLGGEGLAVSEPMIE